MKNTLIALYAQTSIHAGTGQNTGTIDLPIQREAHTDYPCIYGSSMKGALRCCAQQREMNKDTIENLFGPESEFAGDGYAGALLVSDARLLLLPVRSLTTQYRWVTCPAILQRLKQDAKRFNTTLEYSIPRVENNHALVQKDNNNPDKLFLEEYCFTTESDMDLSAYITALSQFTQHDDAVSILQSQLTVISDNDFNHLSKNTTPVRARNVLDSKTKTSQNLWYEESLPPETIMYTGISADNVRKKGSEIKAEKVMEEFKSLFTKGTPWLQVGGNETVGMGWFAVNFVQTDEEPGAQ